MPFAVLLPSHSYYNVPEEIVDCLKLAATVGRSNAVVKNMQTIAETQRHQSPGGRPQPLAFHGGHLWAGSWDAEKLYRIDPKNWNVEHEIAAPGRPYGIASVGDSMFVVVALEDDDRYLYRFTPTGGFDAASKTPCPEFTGSHLAADGTSLYLCQLGKRRILAIDQRANIQREIALPTRCVGLSFDGRGSAFIISADDEFENLKLAELNVTQPAPQAKPIAAFSFDARGLAYDGNAWWTSEREASEIVAFTVE